MAELDDLRQVGDTLQSAASRLAEWAASARLASGGVPYEVRGAIHEINRAVDQWTEIRSKSKLDVTATARLAPCNCKTCKCEPEVVDVEAEATATYSDDSKITIRHAPDEDVDALAERVAPLGATVKQVDRKPGPCPHDKPAYQWCDICHG
jgi:hypothetical protein